MKYDVMIVGGGLVGCSFALALLKRQPDLSIVIIEQHEPKFSPDPSGFDSKIYAVSPNNYRHLLSLGVKPDYSRIGTINHMQVLGNHSSKIEFDKHDCHNDFLAKIIEYRNLHQALYAELQNKADFMFTTVQLKANLADKVIISSAEGISYETKWLVAADGANSVLRRMSGILTEEIAYFQAGVVANFECEAEHGNVAYQWFLDNGVLAFLPLPKRQISIVWSSAEYTQLMALNEVEFCELVAKTSGYKLGKLKLITPPQAFPLKLNLVEKFYSGKVILIGDAAHTIHPLAGQGVNLGFGDAWLLAEVLAAEGEADAAELAKFNYTRLAAVRQMQMTCHLLQRLFHNHLSVANKLRNLGLNLVNHLPPLKKALINSAINY